MSSTSAILSPRSRRTAATSAWWNGHLNHSCLWMLTLSMPNIPCWLLKFGELIAELWRHQNCRHAYSTQCLLQSSNGLHRPNKFSHLIRYHRLSALKYQGAGQCDYFNCLYFPKCSMYFPKQTEMRPMQESIQYWGGWHFVSVQNTALIDTLGW